MRHAFMSAAAVCFARAAVHDWPIRGELPEPRERAWGNFYCSLGFTFLALGLLL